MFVKLSPEGAIPSYNVGDHRGRFGDISFPRPLKPVETIVFPINDRDRASLDALSIPWLAIEFSIHGIVCHVLADGRAGRNTPVVTIDAPAKDSDKK